MKRSEAFAYRAKIENVSKTLDDESALNNFELFPLWKPGIPVVAGDRYRYIEDLFKVVQSHTTQIGWEPDLVPALFVKISIEDWPEWVQPTGAHDAYNIGDKVSFNGEHYISLINGNIWSPIAYPAGWEKQ